MREPQLPRACEEGTAEEALDAQPEAGVHGGHGCGHLCHLARCIMIASAAAVVEGSAVVRLQHAQEHRGFLRYGSGASNGDDAVAEGLTIVHATQRDRIVAPSRIRSHELHRALRHDVHVVDEAALLVDDATGLDIPQGDLLQEIYGLLLPQALQEGEPAQGFERHPRPRCGCLQLHLDFQEAHGVPAVGELNLTLEAVGVEFRVQEHAGRH
mmetsp:Transcript_28912/g.96228  ORF Transcript_28912/g.96228 Transcript_28912/m.96228 type:complete len:212 (+) Transcript_28912:929-1564(+)